MGLPSIHSCLQTPSIAGATSTYAAGPCESGVAGNPRPVARLDASPPPPSRPGERFQLPPPQAGGPFGSPGQWPVWVMVPPLALPPPRPVARLVDGSTVVGCHHPRPVARLGRGFPHPPAPCKTYPAALLFRGPSRPPGATWWPCWPLPAPRRRAYPGSPHFSLRPSCRAGTSRRSTPPWHPCW